MVWLLETYSDSYANNQYRALQQFFKWWSEDEELPNPMAKLLKHCEDKTFVQRRDYAILMLFRSTGLTGKGNKQRIVRFGHDAARATDRYIASAASTPTPQTAPSGWASTTARP
ncbi:hypothetical protein [Actinomadura rupiterrae]|uniref:hypothetical protein n=1 Tax=Actinomadura rupiterrae TaxID=559627 RepID=UPI0020A3D778|nr:hypothetical protein [Actinomadura rupiterrae]MCP2337618.1 site-specific recombinase XerD [Actinomadura rupiterrae]